MYFGIGDALFSKVFNRAEIAVGSARKIVGARRPRLLASAAHIALQITRSRWSDVGIVLEVGCLSLNCQSIFWPDLDPRMGVFPADTEARHTILFLDVEPRDELVWEKLEHHDRVLQSRRHPTITVFILPLLLAYTSLRIASPRRRIDSLAPR